jgi:hypothetical protein
VAATPFQAGETPIPNLYPPKGGSSAERERQMQLLQSMNHEFRERYAINSDIRSRAQAYELAARMQLSAPEAVDFSGEPDHVKSLYGIDAKETEEFGKQLLLARRLAEKGVRFIQICHAGGGNGAWDSHGDMKTHGPLCRATDKPIAGLIKDLKQRGMLNETLVVWTSEFGRTPWSQNTRLAAITIPRVILRGWPAEESKAASSTAARMKWDTRQLIHHITIATCTRRSFINSASTPRRWKWRL